MSELKNSQQVTDPLEDISPAWNVWRSLERVFEATFVDTSEADTPVRLQWLRAAWLVSMSIDFWRVGEVSQFVTKGWISMGGLILVMLTFWKPAERLASLAAASLLTVGFVQFFPFHWNHVFVGLVGAWLLVLPNPQKPQDAELAIGGVRALVVWILVGAGLQKIAYGTYFEGDELVLIADRFPEWFAELLMTQLDMAVHREGTAPVVGEPVTITSTFLMVASNLVWIGEIIAGILLCFRKTRFAGALLVLVLMAPIQLGTAEYFFLSLFIIGSAPFFGRSGERAAIFAAFFVLMVAIARHSGLTPAWVP